MAIFTNGVFPAGGEAGDGGGIIQVMVGFYFIVIVQQARELS